MCIRDRSETATEISGIETIKFVEDFDGWLNGLIYKNKVTRIFLDLEKHESGEAHSHAHLFGQTLRENYLFLGIETAHPILADLRTIKSEFEIGEIQKAVDLTNAGLNAIMCALKPDMMEYQLEATFAHAIRMNGADGNSFHTIAASGADGVILHYEENDKEIKDGSLVLIDLGAQYHQYAADITRTYPASGKFSARQKEIYDIVLGAGQAVMDIMKPGLPIEELNKTCKKYLTDELTRIGLIKFEEELTKYYYHGVSHYLGLDVHDIGNYERTLEPGMVFTVEPGLYIAEEEIGIRIEDDVMITEDGYRNLSSHIIKTTEEIEAFMKNR